MAKNVFFGIYNANGDFLGYKVDSDWGLSQNKKYAKANNLISHVPQIGNLLASLETRVEEVEKGKLKEGTMLKSINKDGFLRVKVHNKNSGAVAMEYKVYKEGDEFKFEMFS